MLYTFPGSGNTWCRLLVEYGTGIFSGEIRSDNYIVCISVYLHVCSAEWYTD